MDAVALFSPPPPHLPRCVQAGECWRQRQEEEGSDKQQHDAWTVGPLWEHPVLTACAALPDFVLVFAHGKCLDSPSFLGVLSFCFCFFFPLPTSISWVPCVVELQVPRLPQFCISHWVAPGLPLGGLSSGLVLSYLIRPLGKQWTVLLEHHELVLWFFKN